MLLRLSRLMERIALVVHLGAVYDCRSASRPVLRLPDAAIHRGLELPQRTNGAVIVEGQDLHQQDAADLPLRVDPELGFMMPAQLRLPARRQTSVSGPAAAIWKPSPNLSRPAPSGNGYRAAARLAFDAMMQMRKIDIATIEAARRG
jgi:hypothetical protein